MEIMILKKQENAMFGLAGALALGVALIIPGGANAAPKTVSEVANYKGADRQAVLEKGAKKEGALLVYTTGTQTKPIMDNFRKKYPFLKVSVYRAGSTAVSRRIAEEYKANSHLFDVLDQNVSSSLVARGLGALQPYYTPEAKNYVKNAIGPDNLWILTYQSFVGLAWNTKEIKESEVPKTYDDLLDPKWKGKLTVSARASTLANFTGALVLAKGEDYVRKLGKQDIIIYSMSGKALSNMVVSGEAAISPAVYSSHMANSARKGASVAWRALGPVYGNNGVGSLARKAPHPHAAMLFLDYVLSKKSQEFRKKLGYSSGRKDIVDRGKPEEILWLTSRPNYLKDFAKWNKLQRQVFGKGKKRSKKKKK
jgi:iron(III) transport system substrate-binding protein